MPKLDRLLTPITWPSEEGLGGQAQTWGHNFELPAIVIPGPISQVKVVSLGKL